MSFDFVAAVKVHSDFGAKKIKSATVYTFPHLYAMNCGTECHEC